MVDMQIRPKPLPPILPPRRRCGPTQAAWVHKRATGHSLGPLHCRASTGGSETATQRICTHTFATARMFCFTNEPGHGKPGHGNHGLHSVGFCSQGELQRGYVWNSRYMVQMSRLPLPQDWLGLDSLQLLSQESLQLPSPDTIK
ncbi:predicted protein [Aspergillus nidulans FGSC A4]|uniref:Uncharacterized protein n=1 Tax=Emericella nidulans (strain FGSC A4 / ATCC 38163 / CBS 112.46 / NRRL 194 / M139) TaxID=227321 RepID=Q5B9D7_EMENI|nr:hypothetical protein [Aspergillus nidulans FGSC A4]EAA63414.1 predicted protein [Aspergillus nidulans FGSC A4]CBF83890.1 TPA: hypothetical protein ANIA_02843 [Aspergillus nidulans FGSC A4]|eukprot:XP_660447.1 predicted protein [Aspergillus nidulans FGSC A4]